MDDRMGHRQQTPGVVVAKKKKTKRSSSPMRMDLQTGFSQDSPFASYPPALKSPRKPKVYVRVVFLKIGEIDTLKEQFKAEVFVQARWREPALDNCHNVEDIQWSALWNPQLRLDNAMEDVKSTVWHDLAVDDSGQAYVLEKHRVKAAFTETLELQSFPFDVQHLSVLITSQLSESSLELLEDDQEVSTVNLLSFVDRQEWDVREIVETIPDVRSREFSHVKHRFPILTVRTYALRKAGFFVWNVLVVMMLISSLVMCTFAVNRDLTQNRLQLSFTLLLTAVAFKLVVSRALPKLSYLTVLDKYILGGLILKHLVCVWHAVLSRVDDEDTAKTLDNWAFVIFVLAYCIYNIVFCLTTVVTVYNRRKCVHVLEAAYRVKMASHVCQTDDSPPSPVTKKHKMVHTSSKVHTV